ncbi:MAG TPA: hypothetical protein VGQ59_03360 [Cyclobacteriaceae bacterium]|jgi:hypothetical protein|nr:hypothetical protein [Cyclobacteriaceae bacterium]
MKKLEDIPKKSIFEVPDGYFERLPLKIQAKVETSLEMHSMPVWNLALRYALPVVIAAVAMVYYFKPTSYQTEELLSEVSNEHLVAYLSESEINEHDLLEIVNFNESDADSLSQHLNDTLLGDFDVNEFKGVLENEL